MYSLEVFKEAKDGPPPLIAVSLQLGDKLFLKCLHFTHTYFIRSKLVNSKFLMNISKV
jgi:hypothetical protein